jgi:hypothetical protein
MQSFDQWCARIAGGFRADWLTHAPPAARFSGFLVACCDAIFCFAVVMSIGTVDPIHKLHYYLGGLATGLVVGVASALGILYLEQTSPEGRRPYFYESLLIFDVSMMVFVALVGLTAGQAYTPFLALDLIFLLLTGNFFIAYRLANSSKKTSLLNVLSNQPPKLLTQLAIVVLAVTALGLALALTGIENAERQWIGFGAGGLILVVFPARLYQRAYRYAPVIGFVLIGMFSIDQFLMFEAWAQIAAVMGGVVGAILLIRFLPAQDNDGSVDARFSWIDLLAIALIFLLTIDLEFSSDRHHANAYLAAVNDIVHGKTLLVDTLSQYGWLLPYSFAALFSGGLLPVSYSGFSLANSLLVGATLSVVYLLLRQTVRSIRVSVIAILVMIVAYVWAATVKITIFPSTGPTRFIWLYLLVMVFGWETSRPSARRWLAWLKHGALILGIAWSIESGIFCVVLYLALTGFDLLVTGGGFWKRGFRRVLLLGIDIAIVAIGIYGFTYLRSGQWPNWSNYVELLLFYPSHSPIYLQTYLLYSRWLLIAGVYLVSLLLIVLKWFFSPDRRSLRRYTLILGMTVLGLLQFVYWVGNSTIISSQTVPAIFLIVFWVAELMRGSYQQEIQRGARFLIYFFATYFILVGRYLLIAPTVVTPVHLALRPLANPFKPATSWNFADQWNKRPQSFYVHPELAENAETVQPTLALIEKYAANQDRVGVLIPPDSTVEVLLVAQKTNIFPLDDAIIDSQIPSVMLKVAGSADGLRSGDIIFSALDLDSMLPVQQAIAQNLCQKFSLTFIEISQNVAAIQLDRYSAQEGGSGILCPMP